MAWSPVFTLEETVVAEFPVLLFTGAFTMQLRSPAMTGVKRAVSGTSFRTVLPRFSITGSDCLPLSFFCEVPRSPFPLSNLKIP